MASTFPLPAFTPVAFETAPAPSTRRIDPLDADRIGFDAWLLPPAEVGPAERAIRAASWAAGPVTALAVGAGALSIFF